MRIYSVAFFGHRYVDNIIKVENFWKNRYGNLLTKMSMWISWLDAMGTSTNAYLLLYFVYEKITGTITVPWCWCCRIPRLSILITKITFMTITAT